MATHQPGQPGVISNRSISGVATTDTDTDVTAPVGAFHAGDVGAAITGTGIPDGTTISSVTADGSGATLSAAATADGTGVTVSLGGSNGAIGFSGERNSKTNDTAIGAVGVETPFTVLGGTIADQITRAVVDTRNQTNVGAATGPDDVAPYKYEPDI